MIKLFFLLSLFLYISASTIELNYADKKLEYFKISYIIDKNSSLDINQVKNMKFKKINNKHAFSGKSGLVWYKINLKNTTKINKKIFIHNDFAYFSKQIDNFEFANDILIDKNKYNILDEYSNKLTGSTLVYEVKIPPKDEIQIYIKNEPMISSLFEINIYNRDESIKALIDKPFYSIIIISIMLTLAFYNATLFVFNKRKEFLFYAFYMITPAIGLMYKYGIVFSYFNLYGESIYWLNLTAIMMPGFLILFLMQTLNTKNLNKKINYILKIALSLVVINIAISLFINLTVAIEIFKLIFIIVLIAILYLGFYLFKISHPLAKIFAIAYASYMGGMILTILAMSGLIDMNFFTFHSGGIGIIMEGLIFSYLMHYNVKILEQKVRDQREVIIIKNKKAQLGDMISAITHQWKQPLNRITSTTSVLEFKIDKKNEISTLELKNRL